MKIILAVTVALAGATSVSAMPMSVILQTSVPEIEHGGGCRKSSPPGQCCHAGSQPLHCH